MNKGLNGYPTGQPKLTRVSTSPANVTIAIGGLETIATFTITSARPFTVDFFCTTNLHGSTGTAGSAGLLVVYDNDDVTILGEARWHNQASIRTMFASVYAKTFKPAGVYNFKWKISNDGGSGQSYQSLDARTQYHLYEL